MKCYIFTVFRSWEVSKDAAEIKSATSFLNFNVTRGQQSTVPLLGWLEFYCELKRRQLPTHGLDIVWVLMKYMRGFGAADCSLHNLKPYLPYLSSVEAKDFLNQVWSLVALGENELPKNKNEMHLHVCNLELARCLRDSDNILEYNRTIVLTCLRYYVHSQIFCDGLPITEPRPSDRYALLAAHALYECWVETNNSNYLFDCIVICHYALNYSPSNSQFKLLLLKLYHILGGCQGAQEAYISLDIKHMQLDTLGYLHVFPLIMNGYYSYALSVLNVTLKFFTNNYKDSADHITYAYKYDAYTKIPEFIVIRERLNNSVHYYLSSVENTLIDVLHTQSHSVATEVLSEIDVTPHRDYIQWSKLQDNRDLNVLWELDKEENCLNKKVIEQTLNHDLVLLRLRTILLRMIVGVVQISGTHPCENMNGVEKKNISDFDNCNNNESSFEFIKSALITLTETLEEELKTLNDNMPSPVARKIIAAPPDSRLILLLTTNYFGLILDEMRFMFDLISGENVGPDESQLHLSVILLYYECLLSLISNGIIEEDNLKHINTLLQTCAIFVELVCFTCIIISSCDMFLKHNKQTLAKKNKKKKESNVEKERTSAEWKFDLIDKLSECMTESIDVVVSILKSLEKKLREKNIVLGRLIISSKIESKEEKEKLFNISGLVNESLTGSYITSIGLMLKVLKQKVKYLTSLKQ
ncbi:hypothetical protein AAG570_006481 [Ranatra chinensis]|uniref:Uncharacterized protein n=1 Tax=Ranatra chinensis TaxID=642074 RepID=A0ABD0ZB61_9HEMI